jgi:hypothetical protein
MSRFSQSGLRPQFLLLCIGTSRHFAAAQQLWRFGIEADIDSQRDLVGFGFARIFPNYVFRKNRHVVRSPRLLAVYPAMDCVEIAERLANDHPDIDDIPFPERGDIFLAERIHAGAVSFSSSVVPRPPKLFIWLRRLALIGSIASMLCATTLYATGHLSDQV